MTASRRPARTLAAALAVAAAAAVLPAVIAPAQAQAAACAPVQVLGFRGSGETEVDDGSLSNGWSGGELQNLIDAARSVSYGDGFQMASVPVIGVDYPAIAPSQFAGASPDLPALQSSVAAGVADGLSLIRTLSAACTGHTAFLLAGYSQGMIVVHELALAAPAGTVQGVFGVGDPDQMPGGHGVSGTGASGDGIYRYLGYSSDSFYSLALDNWTDCHTGDPVCDFSVANLESPGGAAAHSYGATSTERSQLGRAMADVGHAIADGTATTAAGSGNVAAGNPTLPIGTLRTSVLHVKRTARGAVKGVAKLTKPTANVPDGAVITIQGRASAREPWATIARTRVRRGSFSAQWPAGRSPSQLRAVLTAGRTYLPATGTVPAVAKKH